MNEKNSKYLWSYIKKTGDYLSGQLPSHPNHPNGRNPYAHVALCIKNKFNMTYKDIEDDLLNEVLNYIDFLKNNPQ